VLGMGLAKVGQDPTIVTFRPMDYRTLMQYFSSAASPLHHRSLSAVWTNGASGSRGEAEGEELVNASVLPSHKCKIEPTDRSAVPARCIRYPFRLRLCCLARSRRQQFTVDLGNLLEVILHLVVGVVGPESTVPMIVTEGADSSVLIPDRRDAWNRQID
jgi:hypothetical protein